jgi:cytochrome c oxidase cbb3-type subunit 3
MRRTRSVCTGLTALILALVLTACEREQRPFRTPPSSPARVGTVRLSELQPGASLPAPEVKNPYEGSAYAISEGKRLYGWYNCAGCHFQGGGGIGPPLMDDEWVYGSAPGNVFAAIVEGRPNGMPAFGGKIPDEQVWQIVAFVRSLSGLVPQDAVPARGDHISAKTPKP